MTDGLHERRAGEAGPRVDAAEILELLQTTVAQALPGGLPLEALIERCERPG
jgi:hypothetical protein